MKRQLLRYWLAMNASALQSGAHATKAFVATASAHALLDKIPPLSLYQTAAVFGLAFLLEILNWLDAHPILDVIGQAALETNQAVLGTNCGHPAAAQANAGASAVP